MLNLANSYLHKLNSEFLLKTMVLCGLTFQVMNSILPYTSGFGVRLIYGPKDLDPLEVSKIRVRLIPG